MKQVSLRSIEKKAVYSTAFIPFSDFFFLTYIYPKLYLTSNFS